MKREITGAAKNAAGGRREGDVHAAEHQAHADLRARPAGRQQLGAVELQPEDEHVLRLRGRPDGRRPGRRTSFNEGQSFAGVGAIAGIGYNESTGTFTAIDATDGKVVWQKTWPDACYSGTVTTAGNLVFVGRNAGELQAYDATNGNLLWSFQTGAGANDTRDHLRAGRQGVRRLPLGGQLAVAIAPRRQPLAVRPRRHARPGRGPGAGTGTEHAGEGGDGTTGDAAAGKAVFADNCAGCHGALGTGGNGGPDLTAIPSAKDRPRSSSRSRTAAAGCRRSRGS